MTNPYSRCFRNVSLYFEGRRFCNREKSPILQEGRRLTTRRRYLKGSDRGSRKETTNFRSQTEERTDRREVYKLFPLIQGRFGQVRVGPVGGRERTINMSLQRSGKWRHRLRALLLHPMRPELSILTCGLYVSYIPKYVDLSLKTCIVQI